MSRQEELEEDERKEELEERRLESVRFAPDSSTQEAEDI